MCANFTRKIKEKIIWGQKVKTLEVKYPNKFHRTAEELREFIKENNIKLLELWKYIKKRSNKKISRVQQRIF